MGYTEGPAAHDAQPLVRVTVSRERWVDVTSWDKHIGMRRDGCDSAQQDVLEAHRMQLPGSDSGMQAMQMVGWLCTCGRLVHAWLPALTIRDAMKGVAAGGTVSY